MNDFIIQVLSPQLFWLLTSAKKIADSLMELKYFESKTLRIVVIWLSFKCYVSFSVLLFLTVSSTVILKGR